MGATRSELCRKCRDAHICFFIDDVERLRERYHGLVEFEVRVKDCKMFEEDSSGGERERLDSFSAF